MIYFDRIEIEGFKNVNKAEFSFDLEGVTFVQGKNGVGKSTILAESLFFALYGFSYKDNLNKASLVTKKEFQGTNFNGTRVILYLLKDEDEFIIARHINYSGNTFGKKCKDDVLIYKNGELLSDLRDIKDANNYILLILGIPSHLFLNSILFGQNLKRLLQSSDKDKKAIFDDIFQLDYLDDYKQNAVDLAQELKTDIDECNSEIKALNYTITSNSDILEYKKNELTNFDSIVTEKTAMHQNSIVKHKEKIANAEKELKRIKQRFIDSDVSENIDSELAEVKEKLAKFKKKDAIAKKEFSEINFEFSLILKKISDIENKIKSNTGICPECGGEIKNVKNWKLEKQNELDSLYKTKNVLKIDFDAKKELADKYDRLHLKYENRLQTLRDQKEANSTDIQELSYYQGIIDQLKSEIELRKELIEEARSGRASIKTDIDRLSTLISSSQADLEEILEIKKDHEYELSIYNFWISQFFSPNGIKKLLLTNYIELLNDYIEVYAESLGLGIYFEINTDKQRNSYIINIIKDGSSMLYEELSGGEAKRIDIAIAFAINDLVSSQLDEFNILILDEMFENLDEDGNYAVSEFLSMKAKKYNVFVITHSVLFDVKNANILEITKSKKGTIKIY